MNAQLCKNYRRNLHVAALLCGLLYAGAAMAQTYEGANAISITLLGVPLTAVAMSATGTLIGFAHVKPVEGRTKLYWLAAANTILSSWLTTFIPRVAKWEVEPALVPPMAGLVAVSVVVLAPLVVSRAPDIVSRYIDKFFGAKPQGEK